MTTVCPWKSRNLRSVGWFVVGDKHGKIVQRTKTQVFGVCALTCRIPYTYLLSHISMWYLCLLCHSSLPVIDSCLWRHDPAPRTPTRLPTTGILQIWRKVLIMCSRVVRLPFHPPPSIPQRHFSAEITGLKYHMIVIMLWNACSKHDVFLLSVHFHSSAHTRANAHACTRCVCISKCQ